MSDPMTVFNEKKERVAKTIRREETDKPPFMLIADDYYPYYAGVEKSAVSSFEMATDVVAKVSDDLQYDTTLTPWMPANLMYGPKIDILGGGTYTVRNFEKMQDPEKVLIMQADEYPKLIQDPINYLLETVLPRRFEVLKDINPEDKYKRIVQGVLGEGQKTQSYIKACEEKGSHIFMSAILVNPVDYLFDLFREFTGIVSDIKRCPELVRDAGLTLFEGYKPMLRGLKPADDKAIFIPMHLPAFLSPRDFEKTYWPSFKGLADYLVEQGHNVIYYFEKKYEHLFDYLQELPQKGVIGIFQEDDLRLTKKKLGNTMAVAGGLSTTLMQHGTKQECLDLVKGLIEDLCPGGGYFLAPDTPMMFQVDARPENLKAIADYIKDCKL